MLYLHALNARRVAARSGGRSNRYIVWVKVDRRLAPAVSADASASRSPWPLNAETLCPRVF